METLLFIEILLLLILSIVTIMILIRFIPYKLQTQETGQTKRFREILEREKGILDVMEELAIKNQPSSEENLKRLHEQWLVMAKMLENQVANEQSKKIIVRTPEGTRVITDINPAIRTRADSVETIAKVFKDSKFAPEMLKPFLNDPNNRVRANAVKEIYPYNPKMSLDTLQGMCNSTDKWMRISAAWALGEIGTPETGEMLQLLMDDPDVDVKKCARTSIQNLIKKEKPEQEKPAQP